MFQYIPTRRLQWVVIFIGHAIMLLIPTHLHTPLVFSSVLWLIHELDEVTRAKN